MGRDTKHITIDAMVSRHNSEQDRQDERYNVPMAQKVIASVIILVVAAFLASTVHPALGLVALLAILPWV